MIAGPEGIDTNGVSAAESVKDLDLTNSDILAAIEGKGPLAELRNLVLAQTEHIPQQIIGIPDQQSEVVFSALKKSYPDLEEIINIREAQIKRMMGIVSGRDYVNRKKKELVKEFADVEGDMKKVDVGSLDDEDKKKLEDLRQTLEGTGKALEALSQKLGNVNVDTELDEILAEVGSLGTITNPEAIRANALFLKNLREATSASKKPLEPKEVIRIFEKSYKETLNRDTRRAKDHSKMTEALADIFKEMLPGLKSDLRMVNKYQQKDMDPYKIGGVKIKGIREAQVKLSEWGVSRGLEIGTTVVEATSLTAAMNFVLQAVTGSALTLSATTNPVGFASAVGIALTAFAAQTYVFKNQSEANRLETKSLFQSMRKTTKKGWKGRVRAGMTGISIYTLFLLFSHSDHNVEQSKAIARTITPAALEDVRTEMEQISDVQWQSSGILSFVKRMASSSLSAIGFENRIGRTEEEGLLEEALTSPQTLRERAIISIKAEAGDPEAQAEASKWGIPFSDYVGVGPRVLSLAQLFNISANEIEILTGIEVTLEQRSQLENASPTTRAHLDSIVLAQRNNLDLTREEMANPQLVLEALIAKFQKESGPIFRSLSVQSVELQDAINEIISTNKLSSMFTTFFTGKAPIHPREATNRMDALVDLTNNVAVPQMNALSDDIAAITSIVAKGIKDVYIKHNTAGAENIDVNAISIAPPRFEVDFTQTNILADGIRLQTERIMSPESEQQLDSIINAVENGGSVSDAQIDSMFGEVMERARAVGDFLNPIDEIDRTIRLKNEGESLTTLEYSGLYAKEVLLNKGFAIGIQFFALIFLLNAAAGRLRENESRHGPEHAKRIAEVEKKLVTRMTNLFNDVLEDAQTYIKEANEPGEEIIFPYRKIGADNVRRAVRLMGNEKFVNMNILQKVIARGPETAQIDRGNRYANALYGLKDSKNIQPIVEELLPGFDVFLQYATQPKNTFTTKEHKKHWKKKDSLSVMEEIDHLIDTRTISIAILSAQNKTEEQYLDVYRAAQKYLNNASNFAEYAESNVINFSEKGGGAGLYEPEWALLFNAALRGKYIVELERNMTKSEKNIKENDTKIAKLYMNLEDDGYGASESQKSEREKRFTPKRKNTSVKEVERALQVMLKSSRHVDEEQPFSEIEGILKALFEKIGEQLAGAASGEGKVEQTQKAKEKGEKQVEAIAAVLETTKKAFTRAIQNEFKNGKYVVQGNTDVDINSLDSAFAITLSVVDTDSGRIVASVREGINDLFTTGMNSNPKNRIADVADRLVGKKTWEILQKNRKASIRPNEDSKAPLQKAYGKLWYQLANPGVSLENDGTKSKEEERKIAELRKEVRSSIDKYSKLKKIEVVIADPKKSKEEASKDLADAMEEYLRSREAKRILNLGNLSKTLESISIRELTTMKDNLENPKGSGVRVVGIQDVRENTMQKMVNNIYSQSEAAADIYVSFDFIKQEFKYKKKTGLTSFIPGGTKAVGADELQNLLKARTENVESKVTTQAEGSA